MYYPNFHHLYGPFCPLFNRQVLKIVGLFLRVADFRSNKPNANMRVIRNKSFFPRPLSCGTADVVAFGKILNGARATVKSGLMNQTLRAGTGNVHRSKSPPTKRAAHHEQSLKRCNRKTAGETHGMEFFLWGTDIYPIKYIIQPI